VAFRVRAGGTPRAGRAAAFLERCIGEAIADLLAAYTDQALAGDPLDPHDAIEFGMLGELLRLPMEHWRIAALTQNRLEPGVRRGDSRTGSRCRSAGPGGTGPDPPSLSMQVLKVRRSPRLPCPRWPCFPGALRPFGERSGTRPRIRPLAPPLACRRAAPSVPGESGLREAAGARPQWRAPIGAGLFEPPKTRSRGPGSTAPRARTRAAPEHAKPVAGLPLAPLSRAHSVRAQPFPTPTPSNPSSSRASALRRRPACPPQTRRLMKSMAPGPEGVRGFRGSCGRRAALELRDAHGTKAHGLAKALDGARGPPRSIARSRAVPSRPSGSPQDSPKT
jgi:hypothetical protein